MYYIVYQLLWQITCIYHEVKYTSNMNLFSLKFYAFILDICICVTQCFSEMNLHCVKQCVKVLKLIKNQASYFIQSCNISLDLNFCTFQYCLNLCPVRVFFYIFISGCLYFIGPLIYVYHKLKEKSFITSRQGMVAEEMLVVSLIFFYLAGSTLAV